MFQCTPVPSIQTGNEWLDVFVNTLLMLSTASIALAAVLKGRSNQRRRRAAANLQAHLRRPLTRERQMVDALPHED